MPKIAYVSPEIKAGHPDENTKKILEMIDAAKKSGADLVVFPEMSVSGYLIGSAVRRKSFLQKCEECGREIVAASTGIAVIFGNIETQKIKKRAGEYVRNIGEIFAAQDGKKIEPKEIDGFFEINLAGKNYRVACIAGEENRLDDFFPTVEGFIKKSKPDFILGLFDSPFKIGKISRRDEFFKKISSVGKCPAIYSNITGIQNTGKTIYTFDGGTSVYNSGGEVVKRGELFAEKIEIVELEEIDRLPKIEIANEPEVAGIYRALTYGIKKFMDQIGMKKVVIGISGGIDSAVATALYSKVLGAENVLLVNMPSVFNSATTKGLSEQLAKNSGCKYMIVPIQESVDFTVKQLEGTPIKFLSDGTSENLKLSGFVKENIQARDRSSRILAALAAAVGGVFTCNANKAETTIGYATMYGDAAGFLAATADLWKFQMYDLANYINKEIFGREVIPQGIIDIVPSAELSNAQNVDEGKGDPVKYPYHDCLFRAFVEEDATPEEIFEWYEAGILEEKIGCAPGLAKKYFSTAGEFKADLERWWKLFTGPAVAKRIQTPPVIAVSKRAFGSEYPESQM